MSELVSPRRRAVIGLVSMILGAAALFWAFPGNAGANEASVQQVAPPTSRVPGNPTCGTLVPGSTEFKYEPVVDGTDGDGTLEVTIDVHENEDTGPTFDWTSNIGVSAVFVKGGPGGLLYTYVPASTGDTGLHAPINPQNQKFYGLSHVSFCYFEDEETTTTAEETTTTAGEETTTTAGEETTTTAGVAEETTTTVAGAPAGELPKTGSGTQVMLTIAGLILLVGGAALTASKVAKLRRLI